MKKFTHIALGCALFLQAVRVSASPFDPDFCAAKLARFTRLEMNSQAPWRQANDLAYARLLALQNCARDQQWRWVHYFRRTEVQVYRDALARGASLDETAQVAQARAAALHFRAAHLKQSQSSQTGVLQEYFPEAKTLSSMQVTRLKNILAGQGHILRYQLRFFSSLNALSESSYEMARRAYAERVQAAAEEAVQTAVSPAGDEEEGSTVLPSSAYLLAEEGENAVRVTSELIALGRLPPALCHFLSRYLVFLAQYRLPPTLHLGHLNDILLEWQ